MASKREILERCRALRSTVRAGLEGNDEAAIAQVWQGERLGVLLWAVSLAELPPYDVPFDHAALVELEPGIAVIRPAAEIARARETARLWHWRARTAALREDPTVVLPERWTSFDQLIAATAMRGHQLGLLVAPLRGDFHAYGTDYRHLLPEQLAEASSIAWERHRAFNWLVAGGTWDGVATDT